ncbi:MAG: tRNA lysidine(34) synthetase TilS [Candidatus Nomurabacteria bacterium]|jgi:tRNA(Ile)-lysidine synthase|nr:tRNA lysidine(34) synthetase TilS [Candidatus Nomurabacteria bacterium]
MKSRKNADFSDKVAVLAVSGGVDSMTMLHKVEAGAFGDFDFVVAHFNHGIREDTDDDEKLVTTYCQNHQLRFERRKQSLGQNASEALARKRRYEFLNYVAKKYHGEIWTAHHQDDLIETMAINLIRGTGWRGLAVFDNHIKRPLIFMTKNDIYQYAKHNQLVWRNDSTNADLKYLRNRVRKKMAQLPDVKRKKLVTLWQNQVLIKREIDDILSKLIKKDVVYARDFYEKLDDTTAIEVLRALSKMHGQPLTIPQSADLLQAIRTYQPHKKFNLPNDKFVIFSKSRFSML